MILLDTSAILALMAEGDVNHVQAGQRMELAVRSGETILVHTYVLSEAAALLQNRLGLRHALAFLDGLSQFEVYWLKPEDHDQAVELLRQRGRRRLSLTDCASFVVMRRYGITTALFFDDDFIAEGFTLYGDA